MATLTVRRTLDQPLEEVWPVLADFAGTAAWNPDVLASSPVGDRRTGLGARRRCEFSTDGRKWTEEEIVEFDEKNHRYTLRIMEGTAAPPVEDVRVGLRATAVGPRTEVVVTATLTGRTVVQRLRARARSPSGASSTVSSPASHCTWTPDGRSPTGLPCVPTGHDECAHEH